MTELSDRTLIYMLFDAVEALAKQINPDLELHLSRTADGPNINERLPIGMFDALWARPSESRLV